MQSNFSFVFFGSFRVSADILAGLVEGGMTPVAVVCSPDRVAGKKKILTPPPVKQLIAEKQLPIAIYQPEKPTDILNDLTALGADIFVVMGYPHIIPKSIISLPRLGTVGVHPSLLPKYRGASPMQTVLLEGETKTGTTLYLIDEKMDHGPVLAQREIPIASNETNLTLEKKAAHASSRLLLETLPQFVAGKITPKEQDHESATYTKKFTSSDGEVDFVHDEPLIVYRKIQSFYPEPGVWTMNFPGYEGKRVKLLEAALADNKIHIKKIHVEGKPAPLSLP